MPYYDRPMRGDPSGYWDDAPEGTLPWYAEPSGHLYRVTLVRDGERRVVTVRAESAKESWIVAEETLGEDESGWVVDHAEPVND